MQLSGPRTKPLPLCRTQAAAALLLALAGAAAGAADGACAAADGPGACAAAARPGGPQGHSIAFQGSAYLATYYSGVVSTLAARGALRPGATPLAGLSGGAITGAATLAGLSGAAQRDLFKAVVSHCIAAGGCHGRLNAVLQASRLQGGRAAGAPPALPPCRDVNEAPAGSGRGGGALPTLLLPLLKDLKDLPLCCHRPCRATSQRRCRAISLRPPTRRACASRSRSWMRSGPAWPARPRGWSTAGSPRWVGRWVAGRASLQAGSS